MEATVEVYSVAGVPPCQLQLCHRHYDIAVVHLSTDQSIHFGHYSIPLLRTGGEIETKFHICADI